MSNLKSRNQPSQHSPQTLQKRPYSGACAFRRHALSIVIFEDVPLAVQDVRPLTPTPTPTYTPLGCGGGDARGGGGVREQWGGGGEDVWSRRGCGGEGQRRDEEHDVSIFIYSLSFVFRPGIFLVLEAEPS